VNTFASVTLYTSTTGIRTKLSLTFSKIKRQSIKSANWKTILRECFSISEVLGRDRSRHLLLPCSLTTIITIEGILKGSIISQGNRILTLDNGIIMSQGRR
jgi:hypothetical protein